MHIVRQDIVRVVVNFLVFQEMRNSGVNDAGTIMRNEGLRMQGYMKTALFAKSNRSRLTKKQTELNLVEFCRYLADSGGIYKPSIYFNVSAFSGSLVVFASAILGACYIFAKSVEILLRDCESVASRKSSSPTGLVLVHNRKRRSSVPGTSVGLMSSRRRSSPATSIISPIIGDVPSMMDLDALCEELSSRVSPPPMLSLKRASSSPQILLKAKRSRSGSSVTEDQLVEAPEFEAEEFLPEILAISSPVSPAMEVEVVTPDPVVGPKKQFLRGLDAKISFTDVQWARLMRAEDITRDQNVSTADLARRGTVNAANYRNVLWVIPRQTKKINDTVSVAEAVDDLDAIIDELRADDAVEYYQDDLVLPPRRSVGGSSFAASRRQSLASDIFELNRDDASTLKQAIQCGLESRGAKRDTIISFKEIVPESICIRKEAACTFVKLLELASRSDLRFIKTSKCHVIKISSAFPTCVLSGSSTSSSSESSDL